MTTVLNMKIGEVDRKIPDTIGLWATTVLNTKIGEIEIKIPYVSGLIKKRDYNAKTSDIETKYFNTSDYNNFTSETLETKIKEKGVIDKTALNRKLAALATKAKL